MVLKFGSEVKSRNIKSQKIEILTRVIVYNMDRLMKIIQII